MPDLERRSARLALVAIALGLLWCFWEVLPPDRILFFRDHCSIFRRSIEAAVTAYAEGRLPLWDAYTGGGEPLATYPAAMAYSPLLPIFALPASFDTLYDLFIFLHYPLAAGGMMFLLRTLRASWSAAILSGVAFALSGVVISLNNLVPQLASAAWAPFALAMALRVLERPSPIHIGGLALFLALHVITIDPAFILADVLLFLALAPGLPDRPLRAASALIGAAMMAFALAGIVILPLIDLLRDTPRGAGFGYEAIAGFSLHPLRLFELLLPGFGGDQIEARAVFDAGESGRLYFGSIYVGAASLPLLVAAAPKHRRLGIVCAFLAVLCLGRFTPVHRWIVEIIPGLGSSRFPVKHAFGIATASSIAAGLGMMRVFDEPERTRRSILLATLLFALAASVVFVFEMLPPDAIDVVRAAAAQGMMFAIAGSAITLAWSAGRIPAWLGPPILTALLTLDLSLAARPLLPAGDRAIVERPPIAKLLLDDHPEPSILLYDPLRPPTAIAEPNAEDLTLYGAQRLEPGIAGRFGVRSVIDISLNAARPKFWEDAVAELFRRSEPERLRLLARWGVTHVLVEANRTDIPGLRFVGRAPVRGGEPISAFRIIGARPLLTIARDVAVTPDFTSAIELMTSTTAHVAVLEETEARSIPDRPSAVSTATVAITEARSGSLAANVTTDAPSLLVAAQRYDRGWRAKVNGSDVPVLRADGWLLAVPIPRGDAQVTIRYWPRAFSAGAWLSAIGLLSLVVLFAVGSRRRRSG